MSSAYLGIIVNNHGFIFLALGLVSAQTQRKAIFGNHFTSGHCLFIQVALETACLTHPARPLWRSECERVSCMP